MKSEIKNIRLNFPCNINWHSMDDIAGVKYCDSCNKKVYDFTDVKQNEFLRILADNNNNVCGRFRLEQMASKPILIPVWQKWVSATLVLLGINVFHNKTVAQATNPGIAKEKPSKESKSLFLGIVLPSYDDYPKFPGGDIALQKFLTHNIKHGKGMINGRVFVQFLVNANGSLSDFKIMRGLNEANNDEVIRALKLSPKWKPALLKNKPVAATYTIPISFQNK